jgi:protein-S-isoprenylcysteine O-methyltransferase Ste14
MSFRNLRKSLTSYLNIGATAFAGGLFFIGCIITDRADGVVLYMLMASWAIWSVYSVVSVNTDKTTFSFGFRVFYFLRSFLLGLRLLIKNPEAEFLWKPGKRTRNAVLFSIVKWIWLPLMLQFFISNGNSCLVHLRNLSHLPGSIPISVLFNLHIYPLLLSLAFFMDTLFFVFGYIFEARFLKNNLRSVDTNGWSWLVTLACYPPFIAFSLQLAPWFSSDAPNFGSESGTVYVRTLLVVLIFIYAFSSFFLGTKASNMTNRGIVSAGTYAWVRHPAYASKVLFWWIAAIPGFLTNPRLILFALFWTFIYVMRAFFEERHLIQDADYREYCKKVPYRFIPGII